MKWNSIWCPAIIFFGRSAQRHLGPQCMRAFDTRIFPFLAAVISIILLFYLVGWNCISTFIAAQKELSKLSRISMKSQKGHEGYMYESFRSGLGEILLLLVGSRYFRAFSPHVYSSACLFLQSLSASSGSSSNLPWWRAWTTGFSTLSKPFALALWLELVLLCALM